jgi:hypothetical protein
MRMCWHSCHQRRISDANCAGFLYRPPRGVRRVGTRAHESRHGLCIVGTLCPPYGFIGAARRVGTRAHGSRHGLCIVGTACPPYGLASDLGQAQGRLSAQRFDCVAWLGQRAAFELEQAHHVGQPGCLFAQLERGGGGFLT